MSQLAETLTEAAETAASCAETINSKVALISMPTLAAHMPSYQLGLLKPTLERAGIAVQNFSFYMYFGTFIGFKLSDTLATLRPCIAGEWIWSKAAFGDFCDDDDYIRHYRKDLEEIAYLGKCRVEDLQTIRNRRAFQFIDFCLERVDWSRFQLIGFSIVFQQLTASLALARRLKEKYPHIPIIFGGAVFEDDIALGIFQGCPYIDYIHCGDADKTFPEMVRRLDQGESMEDLPGLMWRKDGEIMFNGRSHNLMDMNCTPVPDYDEYLYARKASKYEEYPEAQSFYVPIETGRGCWWGMKSQCTFCGLNRAGMEFRSKSPENVLELLQTLARKYNRLYFSAIDNIMDAGYIENLFQKLAENHSDIRLHYEVRPYFSRQQLRILGKGGLVSLQAGIESFSTHVLKLMRKNNTAVQNIAFTKWCTYFGIRNLYNILYGFPGETLEDYLQQTELVDKILHLEPPHIVVQARPERGSHMFENHAAYLENGLTPSYCYNHIFPTEDFDLPQVAYYYSYEKRGTLAQEEYDRFSRKVGDWQRLWKKGKRPRLEYFKSWDTLHVKDTRGEEPVEYIFRDDEARLFEFLHDPKGEKSIREKFGTESWVEEALTKFINKNLVIHLDNRYLNLTLPVNRGF